jgi:hypothetical protein
MKQQITVQIILQNSPQGVDVGIQAGSGHHYNTLQIQRTSSLDLQFDCEITAKSGTNNVPDFAGTFVQGPPANRFIYLDIGTAAGQVDSVWSRRLKIPLQGITTEMLSELEGDPTMILETKIPGTGKDGGPTCGTVKPFMGWYIAKKK